MDLSPLASEITIGCNCIFLLFEHLGFTPTYYTVEDPLVAEDRRREIAAMDGPTKLIPQDLLYALSGADAGVFFNFARRPAQPAFSRDLTNTAYWGGTVTFLMLQIAAFLGCDPIVLVGIDHSYAVPDGVGQEDAVVITSDGDDINHFDSAYFGRGYRWHNPCVPRMESAYRTAKRAAREGGFRIVNASLGGKLEVFPRVRFEELIK